MLKLLLRLEPEFFVRPIIHTNPHGALEQLVAQVDKAVGHDWDKNTVPSDTTATIMYRAGAKGYRAQLLREIHAARPSAVPRGLNT